MISETIEYILLLPLSGFVLNEKFQRNTLKFAIFYIDIRTPKVAFSVFHFVLLYFFPNECPGPCRHILGHSLGKNIKKHEMKNGKNNYGFSYI